MYAEHLSSKIIYEYNPSFIEGFEIKSIEEVKRELIYCKNEEEYIRSFIEFIKENIIRQFNNLNKIRINISIIDIDNIIHNIIIKVYHMITKILNLKIKNINFYKSIFVIIYYEEKQIFLGGINFDGII
jgi:hypothetical protein